MVEINQSVLRQDPYDPAMPACIIRYSVAFLGIERQIACGDKLKFCVIVGTKTFFRRQGKRCALPAVHACDLLLKPRRESMLALDKFLPIAVGCGGMILRRNMK